MKILFVNDYAVPQGGAEIMVLGLRDELRARGHDARLFASNAGESRNATLADYTCRGTTSRFRTLLQSANPWAAIKLRRVLDVFQPDIVHVKMFLTQLSPLILPMLKNVRSVYHVVWYRPICPLGTKLLPDGSLCDSPPGLVCYRGGCLPLRDWFPLMFQMKLWRRWRGVFDLIVANSESVRLRLIAEGIEPVKVIPNGVKPREARSAMSPDPTVAFAGRLVREKGVGVLLRAFAKVVQNIPTARLVICGDGPERTSIERLAAVLNLTGSVSMLGFRPNEEVERLFREAWVVAVPSIWEEPFGHVVIEAMMNGIAVVASGSGGLGEIVRDGQTGFLVQPGDSDALAAALLTLLCNSSLALRLGSAAHDLAMAEFSQAKMIDRFLQSYQSLGSRNKIRSQETAPTLKRRP
jgi:glycosyltransferase involved in cell wall biosynthesis